MDARKAVIAVVPLLLAAAPAFGQSNVSVIPTVSFLTPTGNWVNDVTNIATVTDTNGNSVAGVPVTYGLKAKAGLSVGLIVEMSLSKQFSLAAQVGRTLGGLQRMHEDDFITANPSQRPASFFSYDVDMATTTVGAMLVIRPLGRTPSGAPQTIYFELGGGINIYNVSQGFTNARNKGNDFSDYSYTSPTAMAGVGFSFPVGRRVSLQLFGRGYLQFQEYNGPALTSTNGNVNSDFNAIGASVPKGQKPLLIQIGAGLRVGR